MSHAVACGEILSAILNDPSNTLAGLREAVATAERETTAAMEDLDDLVLRASRPLNVRRTFDEADELGWVEGGDAEDGAAHVRLVAGLSDRLAGLGWEAEQMPSLDGATELVLLSLLRFSADYGAQAREVFGNFKDTNPSLIQVGTQVVSIAVGLAGLTSLIGDTGAATPGSAPSHFALLTSSTSESAVDVMVQLCCIGWLVLHGQFDLGIAGVRQGLGAALAGSPGNVDACWAGYVEWKSGVLVREQERAQLERKGVTPVKEREEAVEEGEGEFVTGAEEPAPPAPTPPPPPAPTPPAPAASINFVQNSKILTADTLAALRASLPSSASRRQPLKLFDLSLQPGQTGTVSDLFTSTSSAASVLLIMRDEEDCVFGAFADEGLGDRGDSVFGGAGTFLFEVQRQNNNKVVVHGGGGGRCVSNSEFVGFGDDGAGGFGLYVRRAKERPSAAYKRGLSGTRPPARKSFARAPQSSGCTPPPLPPYYQFLLRARFARRYVDQDLSMGSSAACATFGNAKSIASSADFLILGLEAFQFV
jgi:hypothetical protein